MPRHPRHLAGKTLTELTVNTVQNRFLLPPTRAVRRTVVGAIARAQKRHQVDVIEFKCMSSHLHILGVFRDCEQMAHFMRDVNGQIAKKVSQLIGWKGPFWTSRYAHVPVTDEEGAQIARLRYLLSNGCKEGLVDRPQEWPGAMGTKGILSGTMRVDGEWIDLTARDRAKRRGQPSGLRRFRRKETVVLGQLPCWVHLTAEQYRARVQQMADDIAYETGLMHAANKTKSVGVSALRRVRPDQCAVGDECRPRPIVHAETRSARLAYIDTYKRVLDAYSKASAKLAAGLSGVVFPGGFYPPRLPFVPLAHGPPTTS